HPHGPTPFPYTTLFRSGTARGGRAGGSRGPDQPRRVDVHLLLRPRPGARLPVGPPERRGQIRALLSRAPGGWRLLSSLPVRGLLDRKSTRLNSSHRTT